MPDQYTRERLENWVSDFCASDAFERFSPAVHECAAPVLVEFLCAACDENDRPIEEIEEPDVRAGLLKVARLNVPPAARGEIVELCAAQLERLEDEGRLSGGHLLAAYARALRESYDETASGKRKPDTRPGARLGRNDPCPCGSGKKYKKCCMRA